MLLRVAIILLVIFSSLFAVLYLATSTKYFDRQRVTGILKYLGMAIAATVLTLMVFAVIVNLDHLF